MRIHAPAGAGYGGWTVLAVWHGKERVIFTGNLYECCRYVQANQGAEQ